MNAVISIKLSDEGTTEPLLLADVKDKLRLESSFTAADDKLNRLIKVARQYTEKYLNRSLISRTVEATIINKSGGQLLPYGPPSGAITVTDSNGNAVSDFSVSGGDFQYIDSPKSDRLTVGYAVEGYTPANLPEIIKEGMLQAIAFWYVHEGDEYQMDLPKQARATMFRERITDKLIFF